MKILITGATGFVGRHILSQIIETNQNIMALSLIQDKDEAHFKKINWLYGDLRDLQNLKQAIQAFNPDLVIHLAWQGIPDYTEVISRINLNNSIELLDFILEETGCKKIIASGSCFEYGKKRGVCKESNATQLNSFFSWAKHALYDYLILKCKSSDVDLIWFRIFYVYGPYQHRHSLIPTIVKAFSEGKRPPVKNAFNKNDFIYVSDIAEAFQLAAAKKIPSGIYNLGSGTRYSVYEVCRQVELFITGKTTISEEIRKNSSKTAEVDFVADIKKTVNTLNWSPHTSLKKGVKNYIKENTANEENKR